MSRLLLVGAASWLESSLAQDTGGPFKGSLAISRENSGQCVDNRGHTIPEGRLFEPGPDECQVCTCLRQLPVLCRTVLCAPPQGCRSLRVGDACCEWVCDQWEEEGGSQVSDLGLRLVASAVTAILSLSLLFFLIYRLRQRRLRGRQNHLEAESYSRGEGPGSGSGGSIEELPLPYLNCLNKEDGAMVRRPFPPSYNEAMFGSVQDWARQGVEEEEEVQAPPYCSIQQDPVISYPVSTLGRLVLPPVQDHTVSSSESASPRVFTLQVCLPDGEECEEGREGETRQTAL